MKKIILVLTGLILFTGIGSIFLFKPVPYVVIIAVAVVTLLIAFGKVQPSRYPVCIYGLALALLWQTSMLGTYIVGVDIHTEYFVANHAILNGWNPDWANNSNTSIVLAFIVPALAKIGFDPIWQFKAFFPVIVAFSPVVLYLAFRNIMEEKRAYFASLLFMIMPMFTMEVLSIVKSQVAYLFVAFIVYFLTSNLKGWQKGLGIGLAGIGASLSHYAVGTILVAYMIAILGVMLITNWGWLKKFTGKIRMPLRYTVLATVLVVGVYVLWFSQLGTGSTLRTVFAIGNNIANVVQEVATEDVKIEQDTQVEPDIAERDETASGILLSDGSREAYEQFTNPVADNTYLDSQEPLVRTALFLDFGMASNWGKAFRVLQAAVQLLLVVGFGVVLLKRRQVYPVEYTAGLIASFGLLAVCLFVPFFTTSLSVTRFYAVTLFFISPLAIIGFEATTLRLIKWGKRLH